MRLGPFAPVTPMASRVPLPSGPIGQYLGWVGSPLSHDTNVSRVTADAPLESPSRAPRREGSIEGKMLSKFSHRLLPLRMFAVLHDAFSSNDDVSDSRSRSGKDQSVRQMTRRDPRQREFIEVESDDIGRPTCFESTYR